eukprot:55086-Amphidinium_carterae.2
MKAHLRQTDVVAGRITADDFHDNGQADQLAKKGTAQQGPLEPDATWLAWADFATKVYHFWRLVGPQLRERPEEEPRARLQAELAVAARAEPATEYDLTEAPFSRQTGKVKDFFYLRSQDCRQLKNRKRKVRPPGFAAPLGGASSSGRPPDGEATGQLLFWRASYCLLDQPVTLALWFLVEPDPQERALLVEPESLLPLKNSARATFCEAHLAYFPKTKVST